MSETPSASALEEAVWRTERALFGEVQAGKLQIPMWLDLARATSSLPSSLELIPVSAPEQWDALRRLRAEIEAPFGVADPDEIDRMIQGIRRVVDRFAGAWYLAQVSGEAVGEIGLVEFDAGAARIGRLLDVDIAPSSQGRGYGNQLLYAIIEVARARRLRALCLKADADRWVKDWYSRLGFQAVGAWNPGPRGDGGPP